MLTKNEIRYIYDVAEYSWRMRCEYNISEISAISGYDRKTIRKYLKLKDKYTHVEKTVIDEWDG